MAQHNKVFDALRELVSPETRYRITCNFSKNHLPEHDRLAVRSIIKIIAAFALRTRKTKRPQRQARYLFID